MAKVPIKVMGLLFNINEALKKGYKKQFIDNINNSQQTERGTGRHYLCQTEHQEGGTLLSSKIPLVISILV